ncbi:MAG: cysteine desulfurase NifS [Chloroflexi bacterium]|nr:cysteine desulfurase NifS [Chloroflexota bacterium]
MKRVYLDYAATTPVHPDVARAMQPFLNDVYGNPSAIYYCGQEARGAVEEARTTIAGLIGAREEEIVFTSGGTESDNAAIEGVCFANENKGNHIITTAIEHHAVLETCRFMQNRGFKVTYLSVDRNGMVDPENVKKAITSATILITIMHANNEVGTIQPVAEIARIAKEAGIYFHTDAVQTAGHLSINVNNIGVDLLSISAHKLYGPKGIGILFIRKGTKIIPFLHGGQQERRRRAGTENVAGIAGFGVAAKLASENINSEISTLTVLRDKLYKGLAERIEKIQLNGHPTNRLPNNVNISIDFIEGESMCLNLDLEGICASTGSACSSATLEPSHVLLAMGLPPEQAHGSLRFTLGKWTTEEDINRVFDVLPKVVNRLRAMSPFLKSKS